MKNIAIVKLVYTRDKRFIREVIVGDSRSVTKEEYDMIRNNIQKLNGQYRIVHIDPAMSVDSIISLCMAEEEKKNQKETEYRNMQNKHKFNQSERTLARKEKNDWRKLCVNTDQSYAAEKMDYILTHSA
mgnify:CR=1 FL=1